MFKIYLTETIKNIQKNKLTTIVFILFFSFILSIFSATISYNETIQVALTPENNETYMEYNAYAFESIDVLEPIEGMENSYYMTPGYIVYADEIGYYGDEESNTELIKKFEDFFIKTEEMGYYPIMCVSAGISIDIRNTGVMSVQGQDKKYNITEYINEYKINNNEEEYIEIPEIKSYVVNYNFYKYEKLTYYKGGSPTEKEFNVNNDFIPIVVGYNFKDYYDVGDILISSSKRHSVVECYYPAGFLDNENVFDPNNLKKDYKIVGILSEDSTVVDGNRSLQNLNTYIIAPVRIFPADIIPESSEYSSIKPYLLLDYLLYMKFVKVLFQGEQIFEVNTYLNTWLRENNFDLIYSIRDLEQIFTYGKAIMSERNESYMVLSAISLVFSIISTTIFIVIKFKKNLRDYAVHMMLGATTFDIMMFGVCEIFFLYLCSIAALKLFSLLPIYGFLYAYVGIENAVLLALTGIFCILVTCITTQICIKKYNLAEIIKGKE